MAKPTLHNLKTGVSLDPPRILIHGHEKTGKTTFASLAPNPIFLRTEDGQGTISMSAWDIETLQDFFDAVALLLTEPHDFQSVVIDSVDWFEPMVIASLIANRPKNEKGVDVTSIEDYGYGKGYVYIMEEWQRVFDCLTALRARGMIILMIAHSVSEKVNPPDGSSYDRVGIKLAKAAAEKFFEYSDLIIHSRKGVILASDNNTKDKKALKKVVGDASMPIELITTSSSSIRAGNRYAMTGMPPVIPFDGNAWDTIKSCIPFFNQQVTTTTTGE
jgi:hypothetical protein